MIDGSVDGYVAGADALIDARRHDEALRLATLAIAADPRSVGGHLVACRALLGLGRAQEALAAANCAAGLEPNWSAPHLYASRALTALADQGHGGADREAVSAVMEAVRLAPRDAEAHRAMAVALSKIKEDAEADAAIHRALRLRPNSAPVWTTASFVAIHAKNWWAAEVAARKALSLDGGESAAITNLGIALHRQGRWDMAAVAHLKVARLDPRSPTARHNVEGIGFQYLAALAPLPLLPLLVVTPLFVAARIALQQWLVHRPQALRPLAARVGIRIATSGRRQRKFDRHAARAVADGQIRAWSAVGHRRRLSSSFHAAIGVTLLLCGLLATGGAIGTSGLADHVIASLLATALLGGGGLLLRIVIRRRRNLC